MIPREEEASPKLSMKQRLTELHVGQNHDPTKISTQESSNQSVKHSVDLPQNSLLYIKLAQNNVSYDYADLPKTFRMCVSPNH